MGVKVTVDNKRDSGCDPKTGNLYIDNTGMIVLVTSVTHTSVGRAIIYVKNSMDVGYLYSVVDKEAFKRIYSPFVGTITLESTGDK